MQNAVQLPPPVMGSILQSLDIQTFDQSEMPAIARHQRLGMRQGYRGDPKIVLPDVPIFFLSGEPGTDARVMRDDRDGVYQLHDDGEKVVHFLAIVPGHRRPVPKLAKNNPWQPERLGGMGSRVIHGPCLPPPKPDQIAGIADQVHGSDFAAERDSTAASMTSLPGLVAVARRSTKAKNAPRDPGDGKTLLTTEEKDSEVPLFQAFRRV